jgi:indole-3-glycerol phosphate synthase
MLIPSMAKTTPLILDTIVDHKRQEVQQQQGQLPLEQLQQQSSSAPRGKISFLAALQNNERSPSLIAEA